MIHLHMYTQMNHFLMYITIMNVFVIPDQQLFELVCEVFLEYYGEGTVTHILPSGAAP